MTTATKKTNQVRFYEGSYQFKVQTTELNIDTDYIQMQLAKQYEYRPTKETLWAELLIAGEKERRFKFDYNTGLTEIKFN
jgi:hypothetical protein